MVRQPAILPVCISSSPSATFSSIRVAMFVKYDVCSFCSSHRNRMKREKNKTETSKTRNLPKCWTQHITSILSVENQVNCICLANEDATLRSYYYLSLNSIQHICVLWKVHIFLTSYFTSYDFILCLLLCIVMKFELFVFATSWITSCIHRLAITIFFVMFFFCCSFGISCICKFVRNKTE